MPVESEPEPDQGRTNKSASWWTELTPRAIVAALILAVVGSLLYDLIVKPGVSSAGRAMLNGLTFGSQALADSIYASASLNPTPVTALILLLALQGAFAGAALFPPFLLGLLKRRRAGTRSAMFKWGKWGIFALNLTIVLITFVGVLLHSAAVGVWRSTQANLTMLGPEVSPQQLDRLRADFAAAQTEADFVNFQNSLERLARKANIELRSVATTTQPPNPHSRTMDHDGS